MSLTLILAILALTAFALPCGNIRLGKIHLARHPGDPNPRSIFVKDNHLVLGSSAPVFDYYQNGALQACSSRQFLNVDENGYLVLDYKQQNGFRVKDYLGPGGRRTITFDGDYIFELCPDDSLGYNSTCNGAVRISLVYQDYTGNVCFAPGRNSQEDMSDNSYRAKSRTNRHPREDTCAGEQ